MRCAIQTAQCAKVDRIKYLIIGIDPGKTAAIACIDLKGGIVCLASERLAGYKWFVETIKKHGVPVLVAFDKKSPDSLVRKISATFGAAIYVPKGDMAVAKKKKVSADSSISNLHERDALASALSAYYAYANKFNQAERLAREKGYSEIEYIKAMVVKKYSIDEALRGKKANRSKIR
ncbi:MAG: DUF460 domain-containing protein [Candidatus Micrarchaeia archaeon]